MTAPLGRAFFDTNILLYMYGGGDAAKTRQAAAIFSEYSQQDRILLSTQVLQEFYAVALRKVGMPRPALRTVFATLLDLPLVLITAPRSGLLWTTKSAIKSHFGMR